MNKKDAYIPVHPLSIYKNMWIPGLMDIPRTLIQSSSIRPENRQWILMAFQLMLHFPFQGCYWLSLNPAWGDDWREDACQDPVISQRQTFILPLLGSYIYILQAFSSITSVWYWILPSVTTATTLPLSFNFPLSGDRAGLVSSSYIPIYAAW